MIKTAVIGTGYLGRFHAEKYARSKISELVAVVDVNQEVAKEQAKKFRIKPCFDYRELPALGVTCASVVSTTSTHFEIASWLLKNGIDVLVEKPMTVTVEEAKELINLAQNNQRILQVGHIERFNPAFRAMKSVLTRPWFFEVRRIAKFTGRGADVDVVLDLMIHDVDIVSHLVGKPLTRVEAVGVPVLTDSIDIANARLTFEGGVVANISASRAAFHTERTIRIFQPDVYISMDYEKKKLKIYQRSGELDSRGFPKIAIDEHKIKERDALEDEINSFLECVSTRNQPEVSGEDGLKAIELTEKIRKAFKESMSLMFESEDINPRLLRAVGFAD